MQVTSEEMASHVGKACSAPLQSPHIEALQHKLIGEIILYSPEKHHIQASYIVQGITVTANIRRVSCSHKAIKPKKLFPKLKIGVHGQIEIG